MKKILITKNGNIPVGVYNVKAVDEHWSWGYHWFDFQLSDGSKSVDYPMPMFHYYIVSDETSLLSENR